MKRQWRISKIMQKIRRMICNYVFKAKIIYKENKGERKKEERIKCKHTSFTLCVCASNENASIFA